jgi:GxGYxYP putative glycoside hydrolase C-terminal domain
MSWGMNPLLLDVAPGLLEFYASTASTNDTFFSATAGAGYTYPSHMPPASFNAYVDRVATYVKKLTGPSWPPYSWEVDIWVCNIIIGYAITFSVCKFYYSFTFIHILRIQIHLKIYHHMLLLLEMLLECIRCNLKVWLVQILIYLVVFL